MRNEETEVAITTRIITLTPELAHELLAKNENNRKVSDRNYNKVRRAIERGEWRLNGEAIKVDRNGFVLDGQHRLFAVVDSGIPIETLIVEGLDPETQDTMDTGKTRSVADVLAIRGYKNTATLASIIRRIYLYEMHGLRAATIASYPTTNHEVLQFFAANPWIESLVGDSRRIAQFAKLPGSLAAVLQHVFAQLDADDAADFFERLVSGENLSSTHPIYALRRALHGIYEDSKGTKSQTYIAAITVKAWNKYRAGEQVGTLKFTPGGANPEAFPMPR